MNQLGNVRRRRVVCFSHSKESRYVSFRSRRLATKSSRLHHSADRINNSNMDSILKKKNKFVGESDNTGTSDEAGTHSKSDKKYNYLKRRWARGKRVGERLRPNYEERLVELDEWLDAETVDMETANTFELMFELELCEVETEDGNSGKK